ncbi:hypothetical protein chiPu_0007787 [Chiloscyllium punctatum]|uniref:Uncharacterized protein n=1 Tax=Chiloscyllium punctatum TaxID=137246 RepID=A0A401SG17_CHIPU|nr:hypothetical protein [Chiloscyllium punctatum]
MAAGPSHWLLLRYQAPFLPPEFLPPDRRAWRPLCGRQPVEKHRLYLRNLLAGPICGGLAGGGGISAAVVVRSRGPWGPEAEGGNARPDCLLGDGQGDRGVIERWGGEKPRALGEKKIPCVRQQPSFHDMKYFVLEHSPFPS